MGKKKPYLFRYGCKTTNYNPMNIFEAELSCRDSIVKFASYTTYKTALPFLCCIKQTINILFKKFQAQQILSTDMGGFALLPEIKVQ